MRVMLRPRAVRRAPRQPDAPAERQKAGSDLQYNIRPRAASPINEPDQRTTGDAMNTVTEKFLLFVQPG